MALEVLMPIITASGEDGVVTAWFVDEGAACSDGQLIAEVQAEKVSAEVEAPGAGRVMNRVAVNDPVPQGSPICQIVEAVEEPMAVAAAAPSAAEAEASRPTVAASPAAKRVAKELGVDLSAVAGSGPGGRITEADVGTAAELASQPTGRTELAGLRAVIARNMRRGHIETAPVTLTSMVDLTSAAPEQFTASLIKAVASALVDHPELNGVRDGDYFTPAPKANISVAIQTDKGLVAPVVVDPASKPVAEISKEITIANWKCLITKAVPSPSPIWVIMASTLSLRLSTSRRWPSLVRVRSGRSRFSGMMAPWSPVPGWFCHSPLTMRSSMGRRPQPFSDT